MTDRIERQLLIDAPPERVWEAITSAGWLAEEVLLDLKPGGDAVFRSQDGVREGWVEYACAPVRLAFWWAIDGEPATRVDLSLRAEQGATRLRVVESRPLELLDLIATPLPGYTGNRHGPALVAA